MNSEWGDFWVLIDGFWDFMWDFKVWGLPPVPIMVGVVIVGTIMRVFLITAREESSS